MSENTSDSIIRAFSPSVADFLQDAIALVSDETTNGLLMFENGTISGSITTSDSTVDVLIETADFFSTLVDQAATVSGTATLVDGLFNTDLTIDGSAYAVTDEDLDDFFETTLNSFLMNAETILPFSNGALSIDSSSLLGDFIGTLGFGDGQLAFDLETPFGDLEAMLPFPDGAAIDIATGTTGTIGIADGQILVDLDTPNGSLDSVLTGAEIDSFLVTPLMELV